MSRRPVRVNATKAAYVKASAERRWGQGRVLYKTGHIPIVTPTKATSPLALTPLGTAGNAVMLLNA